MNKLYAIENYTAHGGPVKGLTLSPNGEYMVSSSFDYSSVIWDTKNLKEKLDKSIKTVESDLEREKSIALDADLNEKRISKEKEELLNTENKLIDVEKNSSNELQRSKLELNKLQILKGCLNTRAEIIL